MNDTKLIGDISEFMVAVELLKRGFVVLQPIGDRLPYDLAIDLNGNLIRIQVRTAYYYKKTDCFVGNVRSIKTNRKRSKVVMPNMNQMDFWVFVVQSSRTFYVVPSEIIKQIRSAVNLYPHRAKYRVYKDKPNIEEYKERWDIITEEQS